jgi:uncharacterized membrane protein YhaH (DUF805 family)
MQFIADYWYVWLTISMVTGVYAIINQLMRMRRMLDDDDSVWDQSNRFYRGLTALVFAAAICCLSSLLLLIAVVLNAVTFWTEHN